MSAPAVPRRVRWGLALALLLLAPVCAEYLTGYDTSTGDPAALLAGLLVLAPLYGAPALLVREAARRLDLGWPGVLALAAAFGTVQAGVVDQSVFTTSYRDIDYWTELFLPTYVETLGLGVQPALAFVTGHAVFSYGAPIALVEHLSPDAARRPWLRRPGLVAAALLYLTAAWLVRDDHLRTQAEQATAAQVAGSLAVAALLVLLALTLGRRRAVRRGAAVPGPLLTGLLAAAAAAAFALVPPTWPGTVLAGAVLAAGGVGFARWGRSERWDGRHAVALASGALAAQAAIGFFVEPLGEVAPGAKYAHNTVCLAGVLLLGWWAARRSSPPRQGETRAHAGGRG